MSLCGHVNERWINASLWAHLFFCIFCVRACAGQLCPVRVFANVCANARAHAHTSMSAQKVNTQTSKCMRIWDAKTCMCVRPCVCVCCVSRCRVAFSWPMGHLIPNSRRRRPNKRRGGNFNWFRIQMPDETHSNRFRDNRRGRDRTRKC